MATYPTTIGGSVCIPTYLQPLTLNPVSNANHRSVESAVKVDFGKGLASDGGCGYARQAAVVFQFGYLQDDTGPGGDDNLGDQTLQFSIVEGNVGDDGDDFTVVPGKESRVFDSNDTSSSGVTRVVIINLDASELSKPLWTWRVLAGPDTTGGSTPSSPRQVSVFTITGDHRYGDPASYNNANVLENIIE